MMYSDLALGADTVVEGNSLSVESVVYKDWSRETVKPKDHKKMLVSTILALPLAVSVVHGLEGFQSDDVLFQNPATKLYSSSTITDSVKQNNQAIVQKVSEYANYPENWDGYSGVPPSSQTISDAITFIKKLPKGFILPRPGLSGDGEISLFWEVNGVYVDIGFIGDNKYAFYAKDAQLMEYFLDDSDLGDELPNAFIQLNLRK